NITIDPEIEWFLCEQALRNLRLRMVYAFVTRARTKAYHRFVFRSIVPLFVQFSEVLRLEGVSVPKELEARIPLMEKQFQIDGKVLRELLDLKQNVQARRRETDEYWHELLFPIV